MALVTKSFSDIITFTRASTATYFDSAGVLTSASNNIPRFDFNPSTLAARGLLIEEQRTNSIRNNTMQGAAAPGTLPTNWAIGGSGLGTLNSQVIDISTVNGINYIDIRFWGTNSTTDFSVRFEPSGIVTAAQGQTWTNSFWLAMVAGSTNNINTINVNIAEFNAGGTVLNQGSSANLITGLTATMARSSLTRTLTEATTASIQPRVIFTFSTTGLTIDITIRIGMPQLELGAFATSVIPTVNAFALGVTREADQASVNTLSPWYNTSGGTIYAEATGPIANIYRILVEGGTASDFRDFSLAFDGLRGNFAARYVAGNFDVFGPTNSLTAGATVKLAGSYSATSADMAYNGVLAVSKNAITQRIPADRMFLGSRLGSSLQLNGHLRRVTYYPRTLSTAELQAITA